MSELSSSSPLPESILKNETQNAFDANEDIPKGITALLETLSSRTETQNYKLFVTATKYEVSASGPIKTYVGAMWNSAQDGTTTVQLEDKRLLVTITWIHT